ncbi:hypothetical protein SAMN04487884_10736 [Butyrivibrio fibrisolvens]|uniref:Dolichyl-phosphate-mannose-protein mannosyltransferase n=1 Tax=Butyrivibrio fibrisolvens TaxID=831 RepID=A0A1H9Q4J8_BUTFI|nr:hypothetical protein [Butyrivibrio fibrisolvens]SER55387.1 hypothetical protein SAMN04487884_10736 [Butyrivibrio fibrisolvens]
MEFIKKHRCLLFAIITLLQILIIIYWGGKRENLYWDEFFTFEKTHYASDSTPGEHYIDVDAEYKLGTWLPIAIVKESLVVTKDNSVLLDPITHTLRKIFKFNSYMVLLNIVEVILTPGRLSIWPAIILNLILFVLNQIILYRLCNEFIDNTLYSVAGTAFYGFSSMCVSMAIFVRFYMFATLLTTIFVYFHFMYYKSEDKEHIKRIMYLLLAFLALLLSYNSAEFTIIYGGFFVLIFSVVLWIRKGFKRFLYYSIPIYGGGLCYIATQTNYLGILFDFEATYTEANGALSWCLEQIADFYPGILPLRISEMALLLGRYMFGSYYVMKSYIAIAIIVIIIRVIKKNVVKDTWNDYIIILAFSLLLFIAFFTTFGLYEQPRYISYVFPEIAIVMVFWSYRLFKSEIFRNIMALFLLFVVVLSVNIKGKVDMLYTGDGQFIETVRDMDVESILLYAGGHRTFISYQTALLVDDDAEFYVYDRSEENALLQFEDQIRDKMLIIEESGTEDEDVINMLEQKGYTIEAVAWTYQFTIKYATLEG